MHDCAVRSDLKICDYLPYTGVPFKSKVGSVEKKKCMVSSDYCPMCSFKKKKSPHATTE